MKLHEFLRKLVPSCNIVIFNTQGIEILYVRTKDSISTELYDYDILDIGVGYKNEGTSQQQVSIYITLAI